jgi:hypothetical protein
MRRWRRAAATAGIAVILAVLAAPGPAAAATYVGLRGLSCEGVTTIGTGLPASTRLDVAVVDPVSKRTLARGRPSTSAAGEFEWRAQVSLSGMRRVRAVIRAGGAGSTPVAWAEQSVPSACPLAATGPDRTLPLFGVGLSSVALGMLLLMLAFFYQSYQGRHVATPGRHLAAPYRGRHLAVR